MIEIFRNASKQWASKGILGLVLASFLLWGVGDIFLQSKKNHVAEVGKHFVTVPELATELRNTIHALEQQRQQTFSPQMIAESGLAYTVLNKLINFALLDAEASRIGIISPDAYLREEISKMSPFYGENNTFNREKFRSVLMNQGITEQQFIQMLQKESNRQQLLTTLKQFASTTDFPYFMAPLYYQWVYAPRAVKIVHYQDKELGSVKKPTEEDLHDFYNREGRHFVQPETRDITVVWIDPKKKAAHISISDAQIQQYYQENKATFKIPQTRKVQWVDCDTEEQALAFSNKLKNNSKFSGEKPQTKTITEEMFAPEVAQILFTLPLNEVSPPFQSGNTYRIYKIIALEKEKNAPFNTVQQSIKEKLQVEANQQNFHDEIKNLDDELASGMSLEELTKNHSLQSKSVQNITQMAKIAQNFPESFTSEIEKHLFVLTEEEISPFLLLPSGEYIAIKINKIVPKKQPSLEEIKEKVTEAWLVKQRQIQADQKANTLASLLQKGKTMEEAVQEAGGKVQKVEIIFSEPAPEITSEILKILVTLTPRKYAVVRSDDKTSVVYLDRVLSVTPNEKELKMLEEQLKESWMEDLLQSYIETIRRQIPVSINHHLVQAIVS
jgi:peptidyl-prolyl cis-trans isomerase D